jgi:hypothetical protein
MTVTLADQERDITYPGGEPKKVRDAYDRQQKGGKK